MLIILIIWVVSMLIIVGSFSALLLYSDSTIYAMDVLHIVFFGLFGPITLFFIIVGAFCEIIPDIEYIMYNGWDKIIKWLNTTKVYKKGN